MPLCIWNKLISSTVRHPSCDGAKGAFLSACMTYRLAWIWYGRTEMRINTHTHTYTNIRIYVCVCVCLCMYVCVCIYIYIYIRVQVTVYVNYIVFSLFHGNSIRNTHRNSSPKHSAGSDPSFMKADSFVTFQYYVLNLQVLL